MKRLEINYSLGVMDSLVSLARYNFVNRTVNNKNAKVLDFGCGSGYGTRVLKEKYDSVDAFDIYPDGFKPTDIEVTENINELQKKYYDVVTCFEVIEHMGEADQNKLMDNLCNLISDNGVLFISTVRKMDPPPTLNRREEHVRELTFNELYEFCHHRFNNVLTFGQVDQVITTFYPENHYHFVFICVGPKR